MHQTRIRRAYYRIFRVANTPDLGSNGCHKYLNTQVEHYALFHQVLSVRSAVRSMSLNWRIKQSV